MTDAQPPEGSVPTPPSQPSTQEEWWGSSAERKAPSGPMASRSMPRPSAVQQAVPSTPASPSGRSGINLGEHAGWSLAVLACAGAMILGALTPWVTFKSLLVSHDVTGVSLSSEGWITLVAAIVVALAGLTLLLASLDVVGRRLVSLTVAGGAAASLATVIFVLDHLQGNGIHVAWGVIVTLLASILAFIVGVVLNLTPGD